MDESTTSLFNRVEFFADIKVVVGDDDADLKGEETLVSAPLGQGDGDGDGDWSVFDWI
jgi:hypothetical protein